MPIIPIDRNRADREPSHDEVLAAVRDLLPDVAGATLDPGQFNEYYERARDLAKERLLQRFLEEYAATRTRADSAA